MFGNENPVFEYFTSGKRITAEAAQDIVGKTFVKLTVGGETQKPMITTANKGEHPFGVAGWSVEKEEKVTVFRNGILSITAGEALPSGSLITIGAGGKAFIAQEEDRVYGSVLADAVKDTDAAIALDI